MPPTKPLPYREVVRKHSAAGFSQVSQRGSHVKFVKLNGAGAIVVIVPRHREVMVGTLRNIIRQAGMAHEEFEAL